MQVWMWAVITILDNKSVYDVDIDFEALLCLKNVESDCNLMQQ
ncbi:MAG: hypothetical protein ACLS9K_14555 [Lachnospira eligens]